MIEHHLSSCQIKARKMKIQFWTGLQPETSSIPVQCFTNLAVKLTGS